MMVMNGDDDDVDGDGDSRKAASIPHMCIHIQKAWEESWRLSVFSPAPYLSQLTVQIKRPQIRKKQIETLLVVISSHGSRKAFCFSF